MFVGHYGVSFCGRAVEPRLPLWMLFVAVAGLDLVWAPLVMHGVEKVRLIPPPFKLDLYYMPYSHGLVTAVVWSSLGLVAGRLWCSCGSWQPAAIVSAAVLSHWMLDFIVHAPDLPLYDNTAKVGLGLWSFPIAGFALEAGVFCGGIAFYFSRLPDPRKAAIVVLGAVMLAVHAYLVFGPPPPSDKLAAVIAIATATAFTVSIALIERPVRSKYPST